MAQVRLDPDVEDMVREWAEDHDCSLSAAVNAMLRELEDGPPPRPPSRALVTSARRRLR